ncbi:hypothetical protein L581_1331 [Serratia fonticola AU-AP2C]|nr:hypothetical protein L581_1331 [Serratia fonticola AU-AP2C]
MSKTIMTGTDRQANNIIKDMTEDLWQAKKNHKVYIAG